MWTNYMKRTYKGLSKDYLVAWLLGRLTRYIPGGFSTISTRVDQVLPQDKDHKKLLKGLIEEQFIGPFLTIITIGFLYLYGLEDLKIMEVFFIFFIVYVVFRYLFLNFVTKETSILTNPFYMFFNIFTMFLFLFIISSYFYESNSLLNTIRYQLSTSVSLLFVGVPAGLGIREFIFINFETEVLSKNLIVLYALSVRYHMIFLDFLCGISGLFLRAFKK